MSFSSETPLHDASMNVPPEPMLLDGEDFAFEEPAKEEQYQKARAELLLSEDPRAKNNWWLLLIITAAVFIFFQQGNLGPIQIGVLLGILVFHELGHVIAMRWFGYTDVRMFFIPFFGAAVMGKKHAAPAWQQAWVALLGPLPGLVVALAGYLVLRDDLPHGAWYVIVMLVALNGFNLLPLGFLDGGRFFSIILFSRNAWVEATMQVVSAGLLGLLAYYQHSIYLGVLAFFMLLGTPLIFRKGLMVARLRQTGIQLPMTIEQLQPLHIRMLFAATYDVLGGAKADAKLLAANMRELHHRVLVPPPGWPATVGFLLIYLLACAIAFGAIALPVYDRQQLMKEYLDQHIKLVFPKQMALVNAQQEVQRLEGAARQKAQEKVSRLKKEYLEAKKKLRPLQEKLKSFDFFDRQHMLDINDDEVDDQDDPNKQ